MREATGVERRTGRVARVSADFGFVECDEFPGEDLYFRTSWFRGRAPLVQGDEVTFELRSYGEKRQAHHLSRIGEEGERLDPEDVGGRGTPTTEGLLDWAYLGYLPSALRRLGGSGGQGLALPERWEFRDTPANPEKPFPILFSYLHQTFGKLVLEEKVLVSRDGKFAAFNTGLVDPRYEAIYALFSPNSEQRMPWRLADFCIAGEGPHGQNLVRHFKPLPKPAHYFEEPSDLLYDTRMGTPEMDWRHVVVDRMERYPQEFLDDNWPRGCDVKDTTGMTFNERRDYWQSVGTAVEQDNRTFRGIMNRLRDAVDLSIKRASWNFKTAVPQYYPRVRHLQLLLPICLVSDERADMALAVEKTASGSYLGHTVLPLDWAYKNARLVCRPDSDWLAADKIEEGSSEEDSE